MSDGASSASGEHITHDLVGPSIVAGGAGAIGAAIARGLGALGSEVAVIDRDGERAEAVAVQIAERGPKAIGVAADVRESGSVKRAVDACRVALGEPAILVHAVGIFPRSTVVDTIEDEWDRVLDTNLKSAFLLSNAVLPAMLAAGRGRILFITSELGTTGAPRGAHYAASKAGLDALARSMAAEVADRGVTVNTLAPGLTESPMMRGANGQEYVDSVAARYPGGRLGQPEDVVALATFLLGERAAHITGQVYRLR